MHSPSLTFPAIALVAALCSGPCASQAQTRGEVEVVALLRLADVLCEPRYADFVRRNVAFAFDTSPHFGRRGTSSTARTPTSRRRRAP